MVCGNRERKLGAVIILDICVPWCKESHRKWCTNTEQKIKLGLLQKQNLIRMEQISSPLAEFVKVLCTGQVLITAKGLCARMCGGKVFAYVFVVNPHPRT